jgi:hemolysin activation/secretion protein
MPQHTTTQLFVVNKLMQEEKQLKHRSDLHDQSLTREEQDQKENSRNYFSSYANPLASSTTSFWQSLMTNWLNIYGEFFRNGVKMTEYWYDTCWKPWLSWQQQQQQRVQDRDRVKVE